MSDKCHSLSFQATTSAQFAKSKDRKRNATRACSEQGRTDAERKIIAYMAL